MPRTPLPVNDAIYSLKNFLAAMLAFGIALYFNLPRPFWAISTVYVVSNPLSGASASKSAYRILGTLIGGAVTIGMIPPLSGSPEILSAAIIIWVSLCAYLGQLDPTPRSYVFHLAGYTILLTGLPVVDNPHQVFSLTLARVEEIGIAIVCASLVNHIMLPRHAGPILKGQLDSWMNKISELCKDVLQGQTDSNKTVTEWHSLAKSTVAMRPFSVHMAFDASNHRELSKLHCSLQDKIVRLPPLLSSIEDHIKELNCIMNHPKPDIDDLLVRIRSLLIEKNFKESEAIKLRDSARKIESHYLAGNNSELIAASLAKRLNRFLEVWSEASVLYKDIQNHKISTASKRLLRSTDRLRVFRDHRMALFAATATMLSIAAPMTFWIASGWSLGMFVTQISGIFCCRWIGLDNPLILMKNTLISFLITAVISLVINFSILPTISGFLPLVLTLGLVMIPAAAMRGSIPQRIIGTLFCIFLPVTLELGTKINVDFEEMINTDIALIMAVTCGIVITSLVKSAGAEPRARGLLRSGWRIISKIASDSSADHETRLHNLLDIVSLWASRRASIPADSDIGRHDLLRDLRVGYNIAEMQEIAPDMSDKCRKLTSRLFHNVARYYHHNKEKYGTELKNGIIQLQNELREHNDIKHRKMLALLDSLNLSLDKHTEPPVHGINPITREALNAGN